MVRVLRAPWQVLKYIKRKCRGREIWDEVSISFSVSRVLFVVSVGKAASSSHMDAENAINLSERKERALEGASNFDCLRDTTTTYRNRYVT